MAPPMEDETKPEPVYKHDEQVESLPKAEALISHDDYFADDVSASESNTLALDDYFDPLLMDANLFNQRRRLALVRRRLRQKLLARRRLRQRMLKQQQEQEASVPYSTGYREPIGATREQEEEENSSNYYYDKRTNTYKTLPPFYGEEDDQGGPSPFGYADNQNAEAKDSSELPDSSGFYQSKQAYNGVGEQEEYPNGLGPSSALLRRRRLQRQQQQLMSIGARRRLYGGLGRRYGSGYLKTDIVDEPFDYGTGLGLTAGPTLSSTGLGGGAGRLRLLTPAQQRSSGYGITSGYGGGGGYGGHSRPVVIVKRKQNADDNGGIFGDALDGLDYETFALGLAAAGAIAGIVLFQIITVNGKRKKRNAEEEKDDGGMDWMDGATSIFWHGEWETQVIFICRYTLQEKGEIL